jgi:hypothetical protein
MILSISRKDGGCSLKDSSEFFLLARQGQRHLPKMTMRELAFAGGRMSDHPESTAKTATGSHLYHKVRRSPHRQGGDFFASHGAGRGARMHASWYFYRESKRFSTAKKKTAKHAPAVRRRWPSRRQRTPKSPRAGRDSRMVPSAWPSSRSLARGPRKKRGEHQPPAHVTATTARAGSKPETAWFPADYQGPRRREKPLHRPEAARTRCARAVRPEFRFALHQGKALPLSLEGRQRLRTRPDGHRPRPPPSC